MHQVVRELHQAEGLCTGQPLDRTSDGKARTNNVQRAAAALLACDEETVKVVAGVEGPTHDVAAARSFIKHRADVP